MSKPPSPFAELDRLGQAISGRGIVLHQVVADRLGLGATDHKCLELAAREDGQPVTAGYLAEKTGLTTGAVTGVLDRLERAGFVRREKHPEDRRQVMVRVLPDRIGEIQALLLPYQRALHRLYGRYDERELEVITDFMRRLLEVTDEHIERLRGEVTTAKPGKGEESELIAPLDDVHEGRLDIGRGASNLRIGTTNEAVLYRARMEGAPLQITRSGGSVRLDAKRSGLRLFDFREHSGELALHGAIPWAIRVRGGANKLRIDLRAGLLSGLEVHGGVDDVLLELPRPHGTVPVRIGGGCNVLRIVRPHGVAARVAVGGGANDVTVDTLKLGSIGGPLRWETPDFASARDRYDVTVGGGANLFAFGIEPR